MLYESSPAIDSEPARVTGRTRVRRRVRLLAVLLNVVLFGAGLYFQAHPHDRRDLWAASGVAAVALLNSGALSFSPERFGARFVARLRRIALFANALLLAAAVVIAALSTLRDWRQAVLHGMLVVPPLLTSVALRRYPRG
jgi:hypothetical protein